MARRLSLALGVALIAGALVAPSAMGAENWDGVWNTKHDFGSPKLDLKEKRKHVEGEYTDKEKRGGELYSKTQGVIAGDLSDRKDDWEGGFSGTTKYDDNGDGNWDRTVAGSGKFHVELKGDKVSFKGWFKSCGFISCGPKYDWTGEHA